MIEIVVGKVALSQAEFDFHGLLLPLYAFMASIKATLPLPNS